MRVETVVKYCSACGSATERRIPEGDQHLRDVCSRCHTIHYQNPKVITGSLPVYQDKVLMCRRAIEPRQGFWTLPAGFMELGETAAEGAIRETLEEANAAVDIQLLYLSFDIAIFGQITMLFLATLPQPIFSAGEESEEVKLFSEDEIPWDELAFETTRVALRHFFADRKTNQFPFRLEVLDAKYQSTSS